MVKKSSWQPRKKKKGSKCARTGETKEEEEAEGGDLEIVGKATVPPHPPLEGLFTPVFPMGDDVVFLDSDSGLGNELVARRLLNGIVPKGDKER